MSGFDIILGMDWLTANHAIIECDIYRVTLNPEFGVAVRFIGDRAVLNTITGYIRNSLSSLFALLTVGENVPESYKLESLAVVYEFQDAFPEDL